MKKVPVVKITTPDEAADLAGLPLNASVAMADVAESMKEGLLAFSTAAGLVVMQQMLTEELTSIVGAKHAKLPAGERVGNWYGSTQGQVVLGARKVTVGRPRGRYVDDGGEVELDTWGVFASEDLLRRAVVERMLAGVATRRHVDVAEPVGSIAGKATSKSAVSRRFVAATQQAMAELLEADLSELSTAVLMIDGLNVAGEMIVVALVITADGTKVPAGLRLGDTENATVVKDLLADLVDRGLRYEHGILAVLDGSKALRKAVVKVFGERALIQRCTLHKRRNCIDYLPKKRRKALDRRLAKIFANPDADAAVAEAKRLAATLKTDHPDAAGSLLEGLDEMFTVTRLGISGSLHRTLTNTNCIESMISTVRTVTGRVKTWRDGDMKKRWIATGMIEAQRSFRRVKGCSQMPELLAAIDNTINPVTPRDYAEVASTRSGSSPNFNKQRDILNWGQTLGFSSPPTAIASGRYQGGSPPHTNRFTRPSGSLEALPAGLDGHPIDEDAAVELAESLTVPSEHRRRNRATNPRRGRLAN